MHLVYGNAFRCIWFARYMYVYVFVYCCCILNFRCCPDRCKSLERHITLIFRKHKHGFYIIYGDLYIILYICNQFYVSFISTTMIVKFDTSYSKMAYHCFHIYNIPHMSGFQIDQQLSKEYFGTLSCSELPNKVYCFLF